MEHLITTHTAQATRAVGEQLAQTVLPGTLVCLQGDLGAGKTTLTQGFLAGLGAAHPYTSPTFVLMKQYNLPQPTATGIKRVYHADAYRVEEKDFRELGFIEWCADPAGLVILEWPERIKTLLSKKRMDIALRSLSETKREIRITSLG